MNIKKKRITTLYVLILSISILFCGCQYIKDLEFPQFYTQVRHFPYAVINNFQKNTKI